MKIVQILPSLYMGGGEKFTVDLCNELAKDTTNEVILCVISKVDDSMQLLSALNSKVKFVSLDKNIGFDYKIFFKLYQFLKFEKPDIVHTHMRSLMYVTLSIIMLKVPFIHTFHTLANKEASSFMKQKFFKSLFSYFNATPVAITPAVQESIKNIFGKKFDNLILNGVTALQKSNKFEDVKNEIELYKQNIDTKVFINIARINNVKNQVLLIETFKQLKEKNVNAILIIVGSLSHTPVYSKECKVLAGNMNNIYFLDEKNNVGDYLFCADALCLSSVYEGLPLVILEAMSLGKPVLSTPVGGIPDVVKEGVNGYLSKDMSVDGYVDIIKKILKKPFDNQKDIERIFKENYSMEICKNEYQKLYWLLK